jgi:enoyl-CoA hydratase
VTAPQTLRQAEVAGVVTITFHRPEVRNALNRTMVDELHAALAALEPREDVRALVFQGAGGQAFMSGADIAELRNRRRADALEGINSGLFARIERFPRPTVAAIQGHCLGGGCELALACDFRVAGTSAKLGQPEVGLGIMAAAGGTRRLPALVGLRHARRLLFSGAVIEAPEALSIGLVDRVVADDQVHAGALELLAPILKQGPAAVRATKAALLAWSHGTDEAHLQRLDNETQAGLFEHPDKFARMDAFLAKRAAKEQGGTPRT